MSGSVTGASFLEKRATGTASGLAAVLIWSMAAPVVASAVGIDPFLYVALGDGIGAILFLLMWVAQRQNPLPELRKIPLWFFGLGLVGVSIHNLTWVAALQQAPPLEATLIIYTWPLLLIVFATISLRQRFHWYHIAGGLLGLLGIAALLMGRGLDFMGFALMPGHFWAVISALSWSVFSAVAARYQYLSSNFLGVVFALSALTNGAVWYFYLGGPPAPTASLLIAGIAAIFFTAAYALWDFGMKRGNAQLIGAVAFLTPVLAALYLVLLGKAELTISLFVSLVLVIAGIGVAKYGQDLKAPSQAG
jgi:drug/metabolite transporter (DMT)-like permease